MNLKKIEILGNFDVEYYFNKYTPIDYSDFKKIELNQIQKVYLYIFSQNKYYTCPNKSHIGSVFCLNKKEVNEIMNKLYSLCNSVPVWDEDGHLAGKGYIVLDDSLDF